MEFSIENMGWKTPKEYYRAGQKKLSDLITDATITIGGLPDVQLPSEISVSGDGRTTATFSDNGMLYIGLAVLALFVLRK